MSSHRHQTKRPLMIDEIEYLVTFCNYKVPLGTNPAIFKITWECCTSMKLKQQQRTLLSRRNFGSSNSLTIVYSCLLPMGSKFGSSLQKNKQLVSFYYLYSILYCTLRIEKNNYKQMSHHRHQIKRLPMIDEVECWHTLKHFVTT